MARLFEKKLGGLDTTSPHPSPQARSFLHARRSFSSLMRPECAFFVRKLMKVNEKVEKTPASPKELSFSTPVAGPGSPGLADACALANANRPVEIDEAAALREQVKALKAQLAAQAARNAVAPTPVPKLQPSPVQEKVGPSVASPSRVDIIRITAAVVSGVFRPCNHNDTPRRTYPLVSDGTLLWRI